MLQTGRFLLKIAGAVAIQQPGVDIPASLLYLTNEAAGAVTVGETGWIKKVLTALARNSVRGALTDIMKHPDSGVHAFSAMCMVAQHLHSGFSSRFTSSDLISSECCLAEYLEKLDACTCKNSVSAGE